MDLIAIEIDLKYFYVLKKVRCLNSVIAVQFCGCRADLSWYCRMEVFGDMDEVSYTKRLLGTFVLDLHQVIYKIENWIVCLSYYFFLLINFDSLTNRHIIINCLDACRVWWIIADIFSMTVWTRIYWTWYFKPLTTQTDLSERLGITCVHLLCQ